MATKSSTTNKKDYKSQKYTEDYIEIMKASEGSFISQTEWTKEGDFFEKLSFYGEYTPVKTSGNTT